MKRILWPGILILLVVAIMGINIAFFIVALNHPPRPIDTTPPAPAGEVDR